MCCFVVLKMMLLRSVCLFMDCLCWFGPLFVVCVSHLFVDVVFRLVVLICSVEEKG